MSKQHTPQLALIFFSGAFIAAAATFATHSLGFWGNAIKPVKVFAADIEQGFYDAKGAGLKINAGQWFTSEIEKECTPDVTCYVFKTDSVLGGEIIDLNARFRSAYSISTSEKKPQISKQDIQMMLKKLEQ